MSTSQHPTVQNIVATCQLSQNLNLHRIARRCRNVEFNPRRFSAAILRVRHPKTTVLVYRSGKLVVTGISHADALHSTVRRVKRQLELAEHARLGLGDIHVRNIVASFATGFKVDLHRLALSRHAPFITFEPELFPGLVYRCSQPKCSVLVFHSGKVLLTGVRSLENVSVLTGQLHPVLFQFMHSPTTPLCMS